MKDLKDLNLKIKALQEKKKKLESDLSKKLYEGAQKILKDDFSVELVLEIIDSTYAKSSDHQKQDWLKASARFQKTRSRKT